jgi:hypothetical protein
MRKPIYLSKNAVALITIYERPDQLADMWVTDYAEYEEDYRKNAEEAAEQFIEQLDGRYNQLFLRALKKEINKRLKSKGGHHAVKHPVR